MTWIAQHQYALPLPLSQGALSRVLTTDLGVISGLKYSILNVNHKAHHCIQLKFNLNIFPSAYRWILFRISHALSWIEFTVIILFAIMYVCSFFHSIYILDEDLDYRASFFNVCSDNDSGRGFGLTTKTVISHLIYMKLREPMSYLGKDKYKHSTACWDEVACCMPSVRCWTSLSEPCRNVFISCISNSWVFLQAILRRLSLQRSKIQWDFDATHSWQGEKPTHYNP